MDAIRRGLLWIGLICIGLCWGSIGWAQPVPTAVTTVAPRLWLPARVDADCGQVAAVTLEVLLVLDARGTVRAVEQVFGAHTPSAPRLDVDCLGAAMRALRYLPALQDGAPVAARLRQQVLLQAPREGDPGGDLEFLAKVEDAASTAPELPDSPAEVYGARAELRTPLQATSSTDLKGSTLRLLPHTSSGELLNAVPGILSVQHAGGGKANQYFLRGFDADHGSDVAFFVDDVPLNIVSHGHGQGYTDLQLIPPELIERVEIRKGPYFTAYGDMATAGVVHFRLPTRLDAPRVLAQAGSFDTYRSAAALSLDGLAGDMIIGLDWLQTRGPYVRPENTRRLSAAAKWTHRFSDTDALSLTWMLYGADWHAPGQIPRRAVVGGALTRLGSLDPNEGGQTRRDIVAAAYKTEQGASEFAMTAFVQRYALALYSNFTFFYDDPAAGDMVRQGDVRTIYGLRSQYGRHLEWGPLQLLLQGGLQLRQDEAGPSAAHAPGREIAEYLVRSDVRERQLSAFVEADALLYRRLRAVLGARVDRFQFAVEDLLEQEGHQDGSGERAAMQVSPKASLVWMTPVGIDLHANFGLGLRSNDARGVVSPRGPTATPLTAARGAEIGLRHRLWGRRLHWAATAFVLVLDGEAVFVGDSGTVETRGRTRRVGGEFELRLRPFRWLSVELDVSYSDAQFVENAGNAAAVALAPRLFGQAALVLEHPAGVRGRLGALHVGKRPATEDGFLVAEGFSRVDAQVEVDLEHWILGLSVQNLLDADYAQAQFAGITRLQGEDSAGDCGAGSRAVVGEDGFEGCEDINMVAGPPLTVLATVGRSF